MAVDAIRYSTITKMVNIDKAKRLLGYWPIFTTQESLDRSVAWFIGGRRGRRHNKDYKTRAFDGDPQGSRESQKGRALSGWQILGGFRFGRIGGMTTLRSERGKDAWQTTYGQCTMRLAE
jgi:hypothetical protein